MQHDSPSLSKFLGDVHDGYVQLPDFQRGWTWDDQRIVSLLATVMLTYPMGVVMTLQTAEDSAIRFKARPIEAAPKDVQGKEKALLLDGQQRITSLYRVLKSGTPVDTKDAHNNNIRRWYYVDIAKALDPAVEKEDAIISVPEDRRLTRNGRVVLDLSTPEREYEAGMFPLRLALDDQGKNLWQFEYVGGDKERLDIWTRFTVAVLNPIVAYEVHIITLGHDTDKEAVCRVFEKVNTGGVTLNTFELVTATYAASDFELPRHWDAIREELTAAAPMLDALQDTDFLQAVCLVATHAHKRVPACKRKDLLDLPLDWYREWERSVVNALLWTGKFLAEQGVVSAGFLPYRTQLPPLAAIRAVLGEEADDHEAQERLLRWYWCGVFGEQYGGSLDSRFVNDLVQVTRWVRGGDEPDSVRNASFNPARLTTMTTRNSAAYTGVFARLIQQGCHDWYFLDRPLNAETIIDHSVDINRVFPDAWCKRNRVDRRFKDSVINKALFSQRVYQTIGSRAPSLYVQELERDAGVPRTAFDDALASQLVASRALRHDKFTAFCEKRETALLDLIAETGIRVLRDGAPER